jgi:transitional endoplasmic reticulum ATPase
VRDIALLGRDLQGAKEQSYTVLCDQFKNSMKALRERKHQVDHRTYVIAATAYEQALLPETKAFFKKTYPLVIPDKETAGALIGDFVLALNGDRESVTLDQELLSQVQGFNFDDLKDMVNSAAKEAVHQGKKSVDLEHLKGVVEKSIKNREQFCAEHAVMLAKLVKDLQPIVDKDNREKLLPFFVEQQVPESFKRLFEQPAQMHGYYHDSLVYVLAGERGLGKTMAARALAERYNAEFIMMTAEDVLDPIVGKTQKNIEHLFQELKQKEKEGKKSVVMLRGIERLVPANRFGEEEYELKSLRASLLASIKELGEHTVLLLCADTQRDKIHQELIATIGSERCAEFVKPKESVLKAALIKSMYDRLIKQKELAVDFTALADKAEAFTCADLENVVRSAGRKAIVDNAQAVTQSHFDCAMAEMCVLVNERSKGNTPLGMYN